MLPGYGPISFFRNVFYAAALLALLSLVLEMRTVQDMWPTPTGFEEPLLEESAEQRPVS